MKHLKKILSVLCVSTLLLSGCGLIGNDKDDKKASEENIGDGYFKGDTLRTKDAEIKIKGSKLVENFRQDDKRGPYIVFEYEYTNKSKKNMTAEKSWDDHFELIKDTKNIEEKISKSYIYIKDNTKYHDLNENSNVLVKPNDNVTAIIAYSIKKEPSKLILKGHTTDDETESKALGEKVIKVEK